MKNVLNSREMKQADLNTISTFGVPSLVLMERAALAVVEVLEAEKLLQHKIAVICGMGNNGGDGFAVARLLFLQHCDVRLFLVGDIAKMTAETKTQYDICKNYGIPVAEAIEELKDCNCFLDALFGIGLSREITGTVYDVIAQLNTYSGTKVAIDIPSGISADDGSVKGIGFAADMTVTFAFCKVGQLLYPGRKYCGKLYRKDIGITEESLLENKPQCRTLEETDLTRIPVAPPDAHKGSQGKVLCIAGSKKMAGAAYLAGRSALVSGTGMVQIYTPSCNRDILLTKLPEALVSCYDTYDEKQFLQLLQWADVIAIGPGLGTDATAVKLVKSVLQNAAVPVVMDADALNIIALHLDLLKRPHTEIVVTPHLGEMARLTENPLTYVANHKLALCQEFARDYQVVCTLKDASTIIGVPYGLTFLNTSGCEGMATAGSGDVLTGIIAGFIAQGLSPEDAAPLGVYLHGLAGEQASRIHSRHGMVASDLIEGLKIIYRERGL